MPMTQSVSPVGHRAPVAVVALLIGLMAGCAARVPRLPEPLRGPTPASDSVDVLQDAPGARTLPRFERGAVPVEQAAVQTAPEAIVVPPIAVTKPSALVVDGAPLGTFISVVFGTELGFALQIDQAVRARGDLVSLRLTEPHEPAEIYRIAAEVLRSYGVRVTPMGSLLQFNQIQGPGAGSGFITTRSRPDVPSGQRTVFVAVPLEAAEPGRVAAQVRGVVGEQVRITEMIEANALLLTGSGDAVQIAMDAILTLDRPALTTRRTLRINPQHMPAEALAKELRDVMVAEGYSVKTGPGSGGVLNFVTVASANALLVFSESAPALAAAEDWAQRLDQPSDQAGGGGVYMYSARHTTVESMMPILQAMVGAPGSISAPSSQQPAGSGVSGFDGTSPSASGRAGSGGSALSVSGIGGQLAVDPVRNVIVFQGDPQRWRAIENVLSKLDTPARQVVIEVTVAEVTLTDEFSHGIEWALRNVNFEGLSGPVSALGGGGINAGGLIWRALSGSGQVSAVLNLFARDGRVSILSTPRLLVKSGEVASIDVGTEVPIVTSQATAPDLPSTGPSILQQIQYRKTGVLLELQAVVHSGQRVDLKVVQEVSEATPTDTSEISSPSIFSRKLQTSLSLADGQSMLLGGLISSSKTDAKTKIPLLGDIPVVGRAFQNRRKQGTRTELLMVITPYVIEDETQGREITDEARARFGDSQRPWYNPRSPTPPGVPRPVAPSAPGVEMQVPAPMPTLEPAPNARRASSLAEPRPVVPSTPGVEMQMPPPTPAPAPAPIPRRLAPPVEARPMAPSPPGVAFQVPAPSPPPVLVPAPRPADTVLPTTIVTPPGTIILTPPPAH